MIGRVLNQVSGVSLELARITIAGTTLKTYTDAGGKVAEFMKSLPEV